MPTEFQEKVYKILQKVPKGKVTTYGDLAKALSLKPLSSRAIGNAMNKNPYAFAFWEGGRNHFVKQRDLVPCHRVVKSSGEIGGFAQGTKKKIQMLRKEGIEINKNKVNLEKHRFSFKRK